MKHEDGKNNITIAEIAKRAGVSSATVSYVVSDRQDVKISEQTRERILAICKELGYQKGAKRSSATKKQVTIDDIAREAGVSTATVSYIVNDRKDVKISDETRKKVLQICNLRQYAPSPIARLLAGKKNDLIGICAPMSSHSGQNARYYLLLQLLRNALLEKGYSVILPSYKELREMRLQENPEGILCIDLTEDEFYAIKENCFVPIVAVDMIVSDPLFFKAYTDHEALIKTAKQRLQTSEITFVTYPYRNKAYMDDLRRALKEDRLCEVNSLSELREYILSHPSDSFVFSEPLLAESCAPLLKNNKFLSIVGSEDGASQSNLILPFQEMAKHASEMLQNAIMREENKPHTYKLIPLS